MTIMRKKVFVSILIPAILVALVGCSKEKNPTTTERRVLLQTVTTNDAVGTVTYPGRTRASSEASVSFRVSGTLLKVPVKEGDHVRRGQVIAQMDDRDYRVQLAATEAEYTQIKAEAERVMALYADSVGTANNYDKARYGLQQISQKLQHCRDQVSDCVLRAPFDGYVQSVLHEAHETVGSGMPVVSLIGGGQTEVIINIPASENLRRDQFASFSAHFDVLPGEQFPLRLLNIARQANVNQLYEVRLALEGSHPQITPGMSAMVQLTYNSNGEKPIVVPLSAVSHKEETTAVFVYSNGHVHLTKVTLGRAHNNGNVDVVEGLKAGDQIVTSGIRTLNDGEAVRPAAQASKTNVGGLL